MNLKNKIIQRGVEMDIKIYVAHHKEGYYLKTNEVIPIHLGKAQSEKELGILGDDTGDNISQKNSHFCELTALYWMWKNDRDCHYTGLMHYRRYFDFSETYKNHFQTEVFLENQIFNFKQYEENDVKLIESLLKEYDLILPKPHKMPFSVEFNYSDVHYKEDLDCTREIVKEKYPEYIGFFDECMKSNTFFMFNMFVGQRSFFEQYAKWLFDILFELEKRVDISYYTVYQSRVFGFVSERLFGVFIKKYIHDNPGLKVKYLNILNLAEAITLPHPEIDTSKVKESDINIVVSSDKKYVPHLAALFASIDDHSNKSYRYNIFILSSDIPQEDLYLLNRVVSDSGNIIIHNIPINNYFHEGFRSNASLPSYATYNRFLIFSLLKNLNRVLYLDSDMIVLDDLVELYNIDMKGYPIAAVTDYIMTRCLNTNVKLPEGYPELKEYLNNSLGMDIEDISKYFNAGLLLIDLKKFALKESGEHLLEEARNGKFYFQDQDILNKHYRKNFLRLPAEYNVFNSNLDEYNFVPWRGVKEVQEARKKPKIIHYAAHHNKPWLFSPVPFDIYYWKYLKRTPYYERVLLGLQRRLNQSKIEQFINRTLYGNLDEHITTRRIVRAFMRTIKNKVFKPVLYGTFIHKIYRKMRMNQKQ